MFNKKLQTRTKDSYIKRKEVKRLVIQVNQKQERLAVTKKKTVLDDI